MHGLILTQINIRFHSNREKRESESEQEKGNQKVGKESYYSDWLRIQIKNRNTVILYSQGNSKLKCRQQSKQFC